MHGAFFCIARNAKAIRPRRTGVAMQRNEMTASRLEMRSALEMNAFAFVKCLLLTQSSMR
jgi:hypothetical protein